MQLKITMRYYYVPTRMAKMKETDPIKFVKGCGRVGTPLVGMQNATTTLEKLHSFLKS